MASRRTLLNRLTQEQKQVYNQAIRAGQTNKQLATLYYELTGRRITEEDTLTLIVWFKANQGPLALSNVKLAFGQPPQPGAIGSFMPKELPTSIPKSIAPGAPALTYDNIGIPRMAGERTTNIVADFLHPNGMVTEQLFRFNTTDERPVTDEEINQAVEDYQEQVAQYPERLWKWLANKPENKVMTDHAKNITRGVTRGRITERELPYRSSSEYRQRWEAEGSPHENKKPIMLEYRELP